MNAGEKVAGRYVVERELARGGMGAVFVARDEKFGDRIALKIAALSGATRDEFVARFAREARLGHRLGRSPGFVCARDWGEVGDGVRLYLVMDLVEGARPLDLASGGIADRVARLRAAASLVADAHRQGVVHRDLKPANFLVAPSGEIRLADFGLAKSGDDTASDATGGLTMSGMGMGTPFYAPPEQIEDAKRADERADVYALGVMLFQALSGKVPFEGSFGQIVAKHLRVKEGLDPMPRPGGPPALEQLCLRALALDPAKRLPSVEELIRGLDAFRAGLAPVTPLAPSPLEPSLATPSPPVGPSPVAPPPVGPRPPPGRSPVAPPEAHDVKPVPAKKPVPASSSNPWAWLWAVAVVIAVGSWVRSHQSEVKVPPPITPPLPAWVEDSKNFDDDGNHRPVQPRVGPYVPPPPYFVKLDLGNGKFISEEGHLRITGELSTDQVEVLTVTFLDGNGVKKVHSLERKDRTFYGEVPENVSSVELEVSGPAGTATVTIPNRPSKQSPR